MFELDNALHSWRQPFQLGKYYSRSAIDELETHLLDAYSEEVSNGLADSEAFKEAVRRIGRESDLRDEFRREWRDKYWLGRYVNRFRWETNWIQNPAGRIGFMVLRTYSLLVAGLGVAGLPDLVYFVSKSPTNWYIMPDTWFPFFGRTMMTVFALAAIFNLMPFTQWRGFRNELFRLSYAQLALCGLIINIYFAFTADPNGGIGTGIVFTSAVIVGPVLWMAQMYGRRRSKLDASLAIA